MNELMNLAGSPEHQHMLAEYLLHDSDEERLEWLMARTCIHEAIAAESLIPERRVPGCLSGLWLQSKTCNNRFYFSSHSESPMVQGISSFLCDLHSDRTAENIVQVYPVLKRQLGLERLLSFTRKRAVASVVNFIAAVAHAQIDSQKFCENREAV